MPNKEHSSNTSIGAKLAGAGIAGAGEILGFHTFDTFAKRLQKNKAPIKDLTALKAVIFPDAVNGSTFDKIRSSYAGIGFASGYKIAQRTLKFGGQPIIHKYLNENLSENSKGFLGHIGQEALAGSIAGVSEVAILPLDALKIKRQNGVYTEKGILNLIKFFRQENIKLYNGGMTAALRNAPGSFYLFGASAATKQYAFGLKNPKDATLTQNIIASSVGAIASILGTLPLDVVKTRIQSAKGKEDTSPFKISKQMLQQEGVSSFFKSWRIKTATAAPKVIFTMVAAPKIADAISDTFKPKF